jgi:hypothetical protein
LESFQSVVNAAYALASRYDPKVKAIRSWDVAINDRYSLTDMSTNFLVIIDSMCSKTNLDLISRAVDTNCSRPRFAVLRRPLPKRSSLNRHSNNTR